MIGQQVSLPNVPWLEWMAGRGVCYSTGYVIGDVPLDVPVSTTIGDARVKLLGL